MWCSNCMSSCCPCLEDDIEDLIEKEEPDEEQPLSDEQQDKQADLYFSRLNQLKK